MEWLDLIKGIAGHRYSCSPVSYYLVYTIVFLSLTIATSGIYVWRRFIRAKPDIGESGVFLITKKE